MVLQFLQELGYIKKTILEAAFTPLGSSWLPTTTVLQQVTVSISAEDLIALGSWVLIIICMFF